MYQWMMLPVLIATVIGYGAFGFAVVYLAVQFAHLIKAVVRYLDAKTRAVQIETELGYPAKPRRTSGDAAADDAKYRPRM